MGDVFISYSRKDIAFARLLHRALKENQFETWIDWQDIPPSTDWLAEVYEAIEGADSFLPVISKTSIESEICTLEIEHAITNNKRLIPIIIDEIDAQAVHPALAAINWIFFQEEEEFQNTFQSLMEAIQMDQEAVKEHTRLQVRALEWEREGYDKSYLLRGGDLEQAESWLSLAPEKKLEPTALQTRYLLTSRQEATRRQRLTVIGLFAGLVIAIGLGILAWTQRNQAIYEGQIRATAQAEAESESIARATAQYQAEAASTQAVAQKNEAERQSQLARSGFFSVEALSHMEDRLDLAMLLSVEAYQLADTVQSLSSLLSTLEYNPHLVRFLHDHDGRVAKVAFSPDGKYLITAGCAETDPTIGPNSCEQSEILVWGLPNAELISRLNTEHTTFISDLTFNPSGTLLASGGWDNTLIFWDVETWEPIGETITLGSGRVLDIDFSPDGKILVSTHESTSSVIGDQTGALSGEIRFWDAATGELLNTQQYLGQVPYSSLAFNPDGNTLVTAMSSGTQVREWDVETWEPNLEKFENYEDVVYSLAFSPHGNILALGNFDGSIILWDMELDQPIDAPLLGHSDNVNSVAFSPDGNILVSGGGDKRIILWDVGTGQQIGDYLLGHTEKVASLAFHPDEDLLASGSDDGTVILWSLQEQSHIGEPLTKHSRAIWNVAYSPDGSTVASASEDSTIKLWDLTNEPPTTHTLIGHEGHVYSVAFSPDGKILASGGQDGTVRLWDPDLGEPMSDLSPRHTEPIVSLAFHPDGQILASGSMDKTIRLWDINTQEPIGEPLEGSLTTVNSLAFSPDGALLASASCADPLADRYCELGEIRFWEINNSEITSRILTGHTNFIYGIAFSPDGSLLASGSSDKTVILWDVDTGLPASDPMELHKEVITNLAFSPDGELLATSSLDQTINLMDVESRQTIGQPLAGHEDIVTSLAFSPDGLRLASGSFDRTLILWDLDPASWKKNACKRAGRNMYPAEWAIYFTDEAYRRTCPEFPDR